MTVALWLFLVLLFYGNTQRCHGTDSLTDEQVDFFESRIRPVLVEQCYACHNSTKPADGSLELDHRDGLRKGGDGGAILVPGNPSESRLISILRHQVPGLKMPQGGAKLEESVIADLEKWIAMGVPDPRDHPPSADEIDKATSWEAALEKRKQWWSLLPLHDDGPPRVPGNEWSEHPIDQFVLAKLRENDLVPNELADAKTLVRRVYFALIGLPPTIEEIDRWTSRVSEPRGFEALVDHLLESPHFGERWARHWMDWTRYADSHGSEGDPAIENGWLYRDYLIRALNADISYDQLVREHIAGDLLKQPRINSQLGINESLIGTAHWRMVFHGFSPTDALDEKVRFIDDQVNTFSKAFLGLTVSCARCHDHKFDAIGQKDYYALFGILSSCRPGRTAIELPERLSKNRDKLNELKPAIRTAISQTWLASLSHLRDRLISEDNALQKDDFKDTPLATWSLLKKELSQGTSLTDVWRKCVRDWEDDKIQRESDAKRKTLRRWRMNHGDDYASWHRTGTGLMEEVPAAAGGFALATKGDQVLTGIYPAGVYSHLQSAKHPARLTSQDFQIDGEFNLWIRTIGEGDATFRFVVHDYPRKGVVFPVTDIKGQWQWQKMDLSYWDGDSIYVEITTAQDAPVLVKSTPSSWFGVRDVMVVPKGETPPHASSEFLDPWFELADHAPPKSIDEAALQFVSAITLAIEAWTNDTLNDGQALLLDACAKQGLLPNDVESFGDAIELIKEYRRLESEIPIPTRVPSLEETADRTQNLYVRGDHKKPGDRVSRGFLQVINATPYSTSQSGRLELANDVLRKDNPLTRRVIVNRLWHHLFGRGLVATPDNFGRLGHAPTHPELLDHLAIRFQSQGGSIKELIRFLMTSKTWQLSSQPSAKSLQRDPDNFLMSHAPVRRLEGEAIRDSLLAVSGTLDRELYGEPVKGNSRRRSIYLRVTRNALDPFLRAFDFPEPFTTVGRRDVTNVPAQSLTLMNDESVASLASAWMNRLFKEDFASDEHRIRRMFVEALGREANPDEVQRAQSYLKESASQFREAEKRFADLQSKIDQRRFLIDQRLKPIRMRLENEVKAKSLSNVHLVPKPIGRWEFEDDIKDHVGSAHGELNKGTSLNAGALAVGTKAYVVTAPLQQTLRAKTLEAWVQLETLDQRGGGVMTIQSDDGRIFDAIVFGEKFPGQWIAGSDGFRRSKAFDGPIETEAARRVVHVAIAYHEDGQVVGYRDGEFYGKPYQSDGPREFKAGETVVSFGVRHLPASPNKMLSGKILRAQLYDHALTQVEIKASIQSISTTISESQVLAALTELDRSQLEAEQRDIAEWQVELKLVRPMIESSSEFAPWTDLARAMFTFKEFLFVK